MADISPGLTTNSSEVYGHAVDQIDLFYSATYGYGIEPALFTSSSQFFTADVAQRDEFYPATFALEDGVLQITPSLITNTSIFYEAITGDIDEFYRADYVQLDIFYPADYELETVYSCDYVSDSDTIYSASLALGPALQTITVALFTSASATFYNATVTYPGNIDVPLTTNTSEIYTHAVFPETFALNLTRFDNTSAFYTPVMSYGITPARHDNTPVFYTAAVETVWFSILPDLVTNDSAIYTHQLQPSYAITVTQHLNLSTIYAPTMGYGISPALTTNTQTFYTPAMGQGIAPELFTNESQFNIDVVDLFDKYVTHTRVDNLSEVFSHIVNDGRPPLISVLMRLRRGRPPHNHGPI